MIEKGSCLQRKDHGLKIVHKQGTHVTVDWKVWIASLVWTSKLLHVDSMENFTHEKLATSYLVKL